MSINSDKKSSGLRVTGTKKKILDAALIEFAEHGLAGARVDRIASLSGVNKAMIYYHFSSKEILYQEIINRVISTGAQHVEKYISITDDPVQFFGQMAALYDSLIDQVEYLRPIMLWEIAGGAERLKTAFNKAMIDFNLPLMIENFIDNNIAAGRFRNIDSRQAMISFIGMNLMYLLMSPMVNSVWEIDDEKTFRKERLEAIVDLFMFGVQK